MSEALIQTKVLGAGVEKADTHRWVTVSISGRTIVDQEVALNDSILQQKQGIIEIIQRELLTMFPADQVDQAIALWDKKVNLRDFIW